MNIRMESGTGPGSKIGTEAIVDSLRGAQRFSNSPLDYSDPSGNLLGFYRATAITGASVSISAGGILAYLRWSDASRYMALMRIQASVSISGAITAATVVDLGAYVSRGASASGSGGNAVAVTGNNNKSRASMGSSLVADFRVGTTGALTRPTSATADANPFAATALPLQVMTNATGTVATLGVGAGVTVQDLYKWDVNGSHPIILSPGAGESIELQEITAGPTTGSLKWYLTFEWAELAAF